MSSIEETTTASTSTSTASAAVNVTEEVTEVKTERPAVSDPFAGLTAAAPASNANVKGEEAEGEDNEVS